MGSVRAMLRVHSISDACSPRDEPMVTVKAQSDPLDETSVSAEWVFPAALAPGHGELWTVRLDWFDRNADEQVVVADEARQWILAHIDEAEAIIAGAL